MPTRSPIRKRCTSAPMATTWPIDLVARHDRQGGLGELAVDHVQIGPADAAGADPDQDLPGTRLRHGQIGEPERRAGPIEQHRLHGIPPTLATRAASSYQHRQPAGEKARGRDGLEALQRSAPSSPAPSIGAGTGRTTRRSRLASSILVRYGCGGSNIVDPTRLAAAVS